MKKIYILFLFLFFIANITSAIKNKSSLLELNNLEKSKIVQMKDDRSAFSEKAPALGVLQTKSGSVGFPVQPKSLTTTTSWDLQLSFPCATTDGEAGIETDGNYIYVTRWNDALFYRYSMDGTFLEQFTVTGAGQIRDLAFDGQYFYGSNVSSTVYKMDFTRGAETLAGTISAPVSVRAIAYNDDLDAFYVNNWNESITLFDRNGTVISSGAVGTWNSYYGFAYDNVSEGGPYLWGFSQNGSGSVIVQMNAATYAETGVILDVNADLEIPELNLAGGLFTSDKIVPGTFSIGGLIQNHTIFAYKLADIGGNLVYDNDPGVCGAVVNYTISAPENGSIRQTNGLPSNALFPVGTVTNTFELTNSLGVKTDTSFTVTVNDVEPPVISCRPDITAYTLQQANVYDNNAQNNIYTSTTHTFSFADPTPAGATITKVSVGMNVYFAYNLDVYALNVLSLNGNEIGQTAVGAPAGNKTYTLSKVNPVFVKNGTNVFSLSSWWNYVNFNSAVITIEYHMEDGCSQFVSVTPPSASDNCSYTLVNSINNAATLSGVFPLGTTTVLWTATDGAGNTATCEQDITVIDNINPLAVCKDITVYLDETGNVDIAEDAVNNGSTDGCSSLTFDTNITHFTCSDISETNTVVLTVSDAAGNSSTCSSNVTVIDDVELVAVCKDVTLFLDETGHATLSPEDVDGGSGDNCENTSLAVNITGFDCNYLGYNTVVLTVTDNSGNTANCIAGVTVVDILPPQIALIPDVEVVTEAGVCETAIDYPHPYVYDNCEITLELLSGLGEKGIFPLGTTTETWVATDDWGNSDTLSFNVTVTAANAAPAIGTIADVTVDEDSSPVSVDLTGISGGNDCEPQTVTVSAESSNTGLVSVAVHYTEGETGSLQLLITPEMSGESEITVMVTDSQGATASTTFTVTVLDVNHAPYVVSKLADQTVNASYVLKVPVSAGMFADADGDEMQVEVMQAGGEILPEWAVFAGDTLVFTPMIADTGCYHVVVKATDPEGAFATDTFKLCVEGYPVSAGEIAAGGFAVNLYPNPTRGEVTIGISTGFHNVQLTVSDIAGRAVLRKQYTMVERITFDMSDKVSGMYLVTLDIDGERTVKKLVVDRK